MDSSFMSSIEVVNAGRVGVSAVAGPDPMSPQLVRGSCGLEDWAEVLGQAFEVQDPADQVGFLSDPFARSRKTTTELAIQSVALSRCAS